MGEPSASLMWISQAPRKAPTTSPATRQGRRGFAAANGGLARVLAEGRKPAQSFAGEGGFQRGAASFGPAEGKGGFERGESMLSLLHRKMNFSLSSKLDKLCLDLAHGSQ